MKRNTALKEAAIFFAITLGASFFIFWGPLALFQVPTISFVSRVKGPAWAIALFITGGFGPSLTALLLIGIREGREGLRRMFRRVVQFNIGWRWYLAIVAIVLVGTAGQILIVRWLGFAFDFSLFVTGLGSLLPLIILGPLSEELGWRGYAQDRLQKVCNPVVASIILGTLWGLWHLPLFFMVGTSQHELAMPFLPFLLTVVSQSVAFGWLHNHTGGSIWTAIFFHWIYTYFSQQVSVGFLQMPLFNWVACIPYMIVAVVIVAVWKVGPKVVVTKNPTGSSAG